MKSMRAGPNRRVYQDDDDYEETVQKVNQLDIEERNYGSKLNARPVTPTAKSSAALKASKKIALLKSQLMDSSDDSEDEMDVPILPTKGTKKKAAVPEPKRYMRPMDSESEEEEPIPTSKKTNMKTNKVKEARDVPMEPSRISKSAFREPVPEPRRDVKSPRQSNRITYSEEAPDLYDDQDGIFEPAGPTRNGRTSAMKEVERPSSSKASRNEASAKSQLGMVNRENLVSRENVRAKSAKFQVYSDSEEDYEEPVKTLPKLPSKAAMQREAWIPEEDLSPKSKIEDVKTFLRAHQKGSPVLQSPESTKSNLTFQRPRSGSFDEGYHRRLYPNTFDRPLPYTPSPRFTALHREAQQYGPQGLWAKKTTLELKKVTSEQVLQEQKEKESAEEDEDEKGPRYTAFRQDRVWGGKGEKRIEEAKQQPRIENKPPPRVQDMGERRRPQYDDRDQNQRMTRPNQNNDANSYNRGYKGMEVSVRDQPRQSYPPRSPKDYGRGEPERKQFQSYDRPNRDGYNKPKYEVSGGDRRYGGGGGGGGSGNQRFDTRDSNGGGYNRYDQGRQGPRDSNMDYDRNDRNDRSRQPPRDFNGGNGRYDRSRQNPRESGGGYDQYDRNRQNQRDPPSRPYVRR